LDKQPNNFWVCNVCFKYKSKFKGLIESSVNIIKTKLKSELKTELNSELNLLETRITELLKSSSANANAPSLLTSSNITGKTDIQETVDKLEKKDRQYNVVLYGLQFDELFDPYAKVDHIFNILKVPTSEIRSVVIIRRYNLLKVTLHSLRYRRTLLNDSKQLRTRTDDIKKVFINPDLTYDERRRNKELRDLLGY